MNNLFQSIGELAEDAQKLARGAVQQYSAEVEAILKAQSRDSRRITYFFTGVPQITIMERQQRMTLLGVAVFD